MLIPACQISEALQPLIVVGLQPYRARNNHSSTDVS